MNVEALLTAGWLTGRPCCAALRPAASAGLTNRTTSGIVRQGSSMSSPFAAGGGGGAAGPAAPGAAPPRRGVALRLFDMLRRKRDSVVLDGATRFNSTRLLKEKV